MIAPAGMARMRGSLARCRNKPITADEIIIFKIPFKLMR
ncbi:MAG: hypothetical protein ACD_11C00051G0001, partial [uncultured bacterium]